MVQNTDRCIEPSQVNSNLLSRSDAPYTSPSLPLPLSPPLRPESVTIEQPLCYQSEQQLQYQRVMSKPAASVTPGGQKHDSPPECERERERDLWEKLGFIFALTI